MLIWVVQKYCRKLNSANPTFDPESRSHHHYGQIIASKATQLIENIQQMILDAKEEV
jgi:hypothetical protein